jgi:hypothetical protein
MNFGQRHLEEFGDLLQALAIGNATKNDFLP